MREIVCVLCALMTITFLFPAFTPVLAAPIGAGSSIKIYGEFYPMGGTGLDDATRLEFEPADPEPLVTVATGDFSGYLSDTAVCMDFDFLPVLNPDPVVPLCDHALGEFSFTLDSVSVRVQTASQLILDGTGMLSLTGYDDTPCTITFTGTPGGVPIPWQFDLEAIADAVPTPTSTYTPTATPVITYTPTPTPTIGGLISPGSSITISGQFYPIGGGSLIDATRIEFEGSAPVPSVTNATGDFAGGGYITDTADLIDFDFLPALAPDPVDPLCIHELAEFSFRLDTISVRVQTDTQLILDGTGVLSLIGYYDTPATMVFTGTPGSLPLQYDFDLECIAGTGTPPTFTPTPTDTPLVTNTPTDTPTSAGYITAGSSITVYGEFYPMGGSGLADSTRIEFESSDPEPVVSNVTGDFTGKGLMGDGAVCSDFDFLPVLAPKPVDPVCDHESSEFSFKLNSVSVRVRTATQLILDGTGFLSLTGYLITPCTITFTGNPGSAPIDWEFELQATAGTVSFLPVDGWFMFIFIGLGLLVAILRTLKR